MYESGGVMLTRRGSVSVRPQGDQCDRDHCVRRIVIKDAWNASLKY